MGAKLRSRYRGALLGLAVGDCLGAQFEGSRTVSEAAFAAASTGSGMLRFTDDTAMAVGLAESLLERDRFDGDHMMSRFVADHAAEPWRGYGAAPPRIFALYRRGRPWWEGAQRVFGGAGSYGNGGAMRVSPAALFAYPDLDATADLARRTASLTHAHALGLEGAVFHALAVGLALGLPEGRPIDAQRLCAQIAGGLTSDAYLERLDRVTQLLRDGDTVQSMAGLGRDSRALESVPTALFCFLRHQASYADAVGFAVRLGGDTDTIAAMTGGLSGALLGEGAIPAAWVERTEQTSRLRHLADSLCRRAMSRVEAGERP